MKEYNEKGFFTDTDIMAIAEFTSGLETLESINEAQIEHDYNLARMKYSSSKWAWAIGAGGITYLLCKYGHKAILDKVVNGERSDEVLNMDILKAGFDGFIKGVVKPAFDKSKAEIKAAGSNDADPYDNNDTYDAEAYNVSPNEYTSDTDDTDAGYTEDETEDYTEADDTEAVAESEEETADNVPLDKDYYRIYHSGYDEVDASNQHTQEKE